MVMDLAQGKLMVDREEKDRKGRERMDKQLKIYLERKPFPGEKKKEDFSF